MWEKARKKQKKGDENREERGCFKCWTRGREDGGRPSRTGRDEIEDWHAFYYYNYYRLLIEGSAGQPRGRMSDALEVGDVLEKRRRKKEEKEEKEEKSS